MDSVLAFRHLHIGTNELAYLSTAAEARLDCAISNPRVQLDTDRMPNLTYLSLGSNVGNREANLRDAISRLRTLGRLVSVSSFYETEPVEVTDQAWFLNCAVALETTQTPEQLIAALLDIEQEMGRRRTREKGPRMIDLDILLFHDGTTGDAILDSPDLTIPHPAMHQRRFVLEPLAEIAPDARHPAMNESIRELLDQLPAGQTLRKFKR
jgi:2-amino-4-hydroxy-6-hydroxymethyldihydropteridine diphosphokinase